MCGCVFDGHYKEFLSSSIPSLLRSCILPGGCFILLGCAVAGHGGLPDGGI
jgi:hypothetical protein